MKTKYQLTRQNTLIQILLVRQHNAGISRDECDGSLHDKTGGKIIHANGQRFQRQSSWLCYAYR